MTEPAPQRERVTGPARNRAGSHRVEPAREIDEQTAVGEIYMRSLMRSQLRLAVVVLVTLAVTLGGLPLVFVVVPGARDYHILGVPLMWLLLGMLVYPALVLLGWFYVRQAERNERAFTELVNRR
jgi:hypothetical protein